MIKLRYIDIFAIFFSGLLLFTIGLSQQEIISFEARFYLFALEMWGYGISWFPTTYQQPYPDYPVTSTLLIYLFSKTAGGVSKFTAILPSAFAAVMTLMMTYLIGALHDRRWGLYAVGFLLYTLIFIVEARTISLDMYITAITSSCFYLVYSATLAQRAPRWGLILLLLGLGFAFRGPIGLIIPTGVLCVFYGLEKDVKHFFVIGFLAAGVGTLCSIVLLSMAYHVGGMQFVQSVLHAEVFGRMEPINTPPWYFYFTNCVGNYFVTYPLMLIMLLRLGPQLVKTNLPRDFKFLQKLLGWILVILIGLSIPADKKFRYILPCVPALALFCAYLFAVPREQRHLMALLQRFFYWINFFIPMVGIIITYVISRKNFILQYYLLNGVLVALQVGIILYHELSRRRDLLVFLSALVAFILVEVLVVEPVNLQLNRTQDFVMLVENNRHQQNAQLIFYRTQRDGLAIKYLIDMPKEENPLFITDALQLAKLTYPLFFIATASEAQQISPALLPSLHRVYRGNIGHNEVVVFSKNVSHL